MNSENLNVFYNVIFLFQLTFFLPSHFFITNSLFLSCHYFCQLRLSTNSIFLPSQYFYQLHFFYPNTFFLPSHDCYQLTFFYQVMIFSNSLFSKISWKKSDLENFFQVTFLPTETFSKSLSFPKGALPEIVI